MKYEITVEGMGCQMCVKKVNKALETLGAKVESVVIGKAVCEYEGDAAALKEAVGDAGFDVTAVEAK